MFTSKTLRGTISNAQLAWLVRHGRVRWREDVGAYQSTGKANRWYLEGVWDPINKLHWEVHE